MTRRPTCPRRPTTPPRPRRAGIVFSVVVSVIFGFILLVAMNIGITPDKVFTGGRRNGHQRLRPCVRCARAARPDLDRRRRPDGRHGHPVPRDRRPVLLRHVVGDRELADDLRVLARRRDPRQQASGTGSTRGRGPQRTRSGSPPSARSSSACRTCTARSPTSRSRRSRSSACTWPTSPRSSCAFGPARRFQDGPVDARPLEPPDRDRRDDLGRVHRDPVHASAGLPDHDQARSTTRRSSSSWSSAAAASGTPSRPRTGSRAPRSRERPRSWRPSSSELEVI